MQHSLCSVINATCVKFRVSTGLLYFAGASFAFDNFKIKDAVDVGATQILAPVASGCLYSAGQQAQITVFNIGCAAVSNVPVTFAITGALNQTLTGTVPGPIAGNSSVTYTFPSTFDMSAVGTYNFTA